MGTPERLVHLEKRPAPCLHIELASIGIARQRTGVERLPCGQGACETPQGGR